MGPTTAIAASSSPKRQSQMWQLVLNLLLCVFAVDPSHFGWPRALPVLAGLTCTVPCTAWCKFRFLMMLHGYLNLHFTCFRWLKIVATCIFEYLLDTFLCLVRPAFDWKH